MPKNVFDPKNQGEMNLKRNAYDLSKSSVFTTDFFRLYPHFCQEVIPGDTFEIDAQVGFRALPTTFPLQTRVRVSQEFYYCRNRTLQDNFEDMIFKTKEIEHPWLRLTNERAKKMISIGSLGDAFNVPCTLGSSGVASLSISFSAAFYDSNRPLTVSTGLADLYRIFSVGSVPMVIGGSSSQSVFSSSYNENAYSSFRYSNIIDKSFDSDLIEDLSFGFTSLPLDFTPSSLDRFITGVMTSSGEVLFFLRTPLTLASSSTTKNVLVGSSSVLYKLNDFLEFHDHLRLFIAFASSQSSGVFSRGNYGSDSNYFYFWPNINTTVSIDHPSILFSVSYSFNVFEVVDSTSDDFIASNPFIGENPQIRLNVLPFRAYTQVANYYYRFDKNNPYVLNGEAQYNEFIPTHASGPDDNLYDFHYRNWELDRFTSALQSPQFGQAPLVGLIWTGDKTVDLTFSDPQTSDGETYKVTVGVDQDDNIDSILDFSGDVPSADLQRLQRSIQAGLSINDLRVTNSFQRFLENVMRRGLRYRNQLKSHFGVSVDYPDIDIPQYIGGSSSYFDSGQVTNNAQGELVLGDYNGTLQGGTATTNRIRCYCPEHGYIIGIVSITPIPSYAQSISKHMIKHDPFDYFTPEFGKIGFTPIHYSELSPLQNTGTQRPSDVFGYQKAWYDYMEALDEVHGDFRTTLRDFVLSRTFAERPQLSESFTVGSPDQLNDVFVTTKIADKYGSSAKFLGSARFHVRALRPIPMIGTPSLE